jgi:hypothetical protein
VTDLLERMMAMDYTAPVVREPDTNGPIPLWDPVAIAASAREIWAGCRYCLNPRHPGPCAKPGSKAYEKRHGKASSPSGGGAGGGGLAESEHDVLAAAPAGVDRRPSGLTAPQRTALRDYQGVMYTGINGQLRRGVIDDPVIGRRVKAIDGAMAASPLSRDVTVWRGSRTGQGVFGDRLNGNVTGMRWREDAYVSTSAAKRVAADFTYAGTSDRPGLVMRMKVPRGVGAVQVSGAGVGSQSELLLQRGLSMRVSKDHGIQPEGYRLLDVEAVPS